MIAYGRTVNSFAGGFNSMTTFGIYAFNLLDMAKTANDLNLMLDIKEDPAITDERERAQKIGTILGQIFTKLYNVQVPDVEFKTLS